RNRRDPNPTQRKAVTAKDRHRVGCGAAPSTCQIHHIVSWGRGEPTDPANLVLACWTCHHLHHHWTVTRHPDGRYRAGPRHPH
ncbi:MAG: HNH endonuclease, partial [Egibacteraceae bacterium]